MPFTRKSRYEKSTIKLVRSLIRADDEILAIPSVNTIICYYRGYPIAEIGDKVFKPLGKGYYKNFDCNDRIIDQVGKGAKYKDFLFKHGTNKVNVSNLNKVKEAVARTECNKYERPTQQSIALNHLSFQEDKYTVCGMETKIKDDRFDKSPEVDLVLYSPKKGMLLVELKCTNAARISEASGVIPHAEAYVEILNKIESEFSAAMLDAYRLMHELYRGDRPEGKLTVAGTDIVFLLTGSYFTDAQHKYSERAAITERGNRNSKKALAGAGGVTVKDKNRIYWYWEKDYTKANFNDKNVISPEYLVKKDVTGEASVEEIIACGYEFYRECERLGNELGVYMGYANAELQIGRFRMDLTDFGYYESVEECVEEVMGYYGGRNSEDITSVEELCGPYMDAAIFSDELWEPLYLYQGRHETLTWGIENTKIIVERLGNILQKHTGMLMNLSYEGIIALQWRKSFEKELSEDH